MSEGVFSFIYLIRIFPAENIKKSLVEKKSAFRDRIR